MELLSRKQNWETAEVALCGVMNCAYLIQFDWCLRWIPVNDKHGNYPNQIAVCGHHTEAEVKALVMRYSPANHKSKAQWLLNKVANL